MAYPIINSTQSAVAGTPGVSRDNLALGATITFADTEAANAGATYEHTLVTPYDSAVVLTGATSATPSIVGGPDVTGTYGLVSTATIGGVVRTSEYLFAVLQPVSQTRIPLLGERNQWNKGGNTRGWDPAGGKLYRSHETVVVGLAAELTARAAAVTAEASARASADSVLASAITTEASARASADTTLTNSITSEASTRATADTSEASTRATADTAEATTRASADTALDTRLTAAEGDIDDLEAADTALDTRVDVLEAGVITSFTFGGSIGMYAVGTNSFDGLMTSFSSVPSILPITKVISQCRGVELALGGGLLFEAGNYILQAPISVRHGLNASVSLTCTWMRNSNWPNRTQDAGALQCTSYTTSTTTSCRHPSLGAPCFIAPAAQQTLFLMASAGSAVAWSIDTYGTCVLVMRTG